MSRTKKISEKIKSLIKQDHEEQHPETKLPWILAISTKLKENIAAAVSTETETNHANSNDRNDERASPKYFLETDDGIKYHEPREPEKPRPTSKHANGKQHITITNKRIAFQPYRVAHPELLENLNCIISQGMEELNKQYPENNSDFVTVDDEQQQTEEGEEEKAKNEIMKKKQLHSERLEKQYELYSYIFQKFINESTIYQKLLKDLKYGYE